MYASKQFIMPGLTCDHASCSFTSVEEGSLSDKLQQDKVATTYKQNEDRDQC